MELLKTIVAIYLINWKIDSKPTRALRDARLSLKSADREGSSKVCPYMTISMCPMSSGSKRRANSANMISMMREHT